MVQRGRANGVLSRDGEGDAHAANWSAGRDSGGAQVVRACEQLDYVPCTIRKRCSIQADCIGRCVAYLQFFLDHKHAVL